MILHYCYLLLFFGFFFINSTFSNSSNRYADPLTDKFFVVNSSLIANNPMEVDFNINDFFRIRLHNHSYVLENLISRNITLDKQLLLDFHWYFDLRTPGTFKPKNTSFQMDYKFNPDFVTSFDGATEFCCSCYVLRLNCPVCFQDGIYYCEYPFHNYSINFHQWFHSIYLPSYVYVDIGTKDAYPNTGNSYIYVRSKSYSFSIVRNHATACSPVEKSINYLHGNYSKECVTVVGSTRSCPKSSGVFPPNTCDWRLTYYFIAGPSDEFKICFSPFKTDLIYKRTNGPYNHFCNDHGYESNFKTLYHYIFKNERVMENRDHWKPKVLATSGDTIYFSLPDYSDFNSIIKRMQFEPLTTPVYNLRKSNIVKMRIICDGSYSSNSVFFNGQPSWIGDKLIHPSCSKYVDFNGTHFICYDSLFLKHVLYCSDNLFVSKDTITSKSLIHFTKNVPSGGGANFNSTTCQLLNNTGFCSFDDLVNKYFYEYIHYNNRTVYNDWLKFDSYYFNFLEFLKGFLTTFLKNLEVVLSQIRIDIYPALNKSLDNAVNNMLNAMGMNDENLYFYEGKCIDQCKYGAVGNWISGIFYSLIEPFFKAFIEIVLKSFILPLLQGITLVVTDLVQPLEELGTALLKVISQLALSLTKLLVIIFKLTIGIIIFLESYILLFEYSLLFLFIMKYVVTDVYFSLVVVLLFSIIFGIVRKSPSLLITFMNPDYMMFDLSHYYTKEFDYNYTLAFVEGSVLHIFSLSSFNKTSLGLY